jgi:hypothetical protein
MDPGSLEMKHQLEHWGAVVEVLGLDLGWALTMITMKERQVSLEYLWREVVMMIRQLHLVEEMHTTSLGLLVHLDGLDPRDQLVLREKEVYPEEMVLLVQMVFLVHPDMCLSFHCKGPMARGLIMLRHSDKC